MVRLKVKKKIKFEEGKIFQFLMVRLKVFFYFDDDDTFDYFNSLWCD